MKTVMCVFERRDDAERAMNRLYERGINRDVVHLEGGSASSPSAVSSGTSDDRPGFFTNLFNELFGGEQAGEADYYDEAVRRGNTVLVIDAADDQELAMVRTEIEDMGGTVDVQERAAQWRAEGWAGPAATGDQAVMPVVQEELKVGKRTVETGGIRVMQRVTETPVKEMVRLREERAVVERRPADRPATEADLARQEGAAVEVRAMSEEAVVSKSARVVEEVVVGKQVEERTETVSDTVRRTDVDVEQLPAEQSESTGIGTKKRVRKP
jgi:uncharacterized protein (TIGR02271 family)